MTLAGNERTNERSATIYKIKPFITNRNELGRQIRNIKYDVKYNAI